MNATVIATRRRLHNHWAKKDQALHRAFLECLATFAGRYFHHLPNHLVSRLSNTVIASKHGSLIEKIQ
jgi:hypothetical protein